MTSAPSVAAPPAAPRASAATLDRFSYDDDIVRKFLFATLIWGVVGMLVGHLLLTRVLTLHQHFSS